MKRIKLAIITLGTLLSFCMPSLAVAATLQSQSDACKGLNQLGGTTCNEANPDQSHGQRQIAAIAKTVINIISFLTGIAAVIMIVVAGVRLVASGGSSEGVNGAKNMLIYAIIGLAVVVLSQAIVHFVLNALINNTVTQN